MQTRMKRAEKRINLAKTNKLGENTRMITSPKNMLSHLEKDRLLRHKNYFSKRGNKEVIQSLQNMQMSSYFTGHKENVENNISNSIRTYLRSKKERVKYATNKEADKIGPMKINCKDRKRMLNSKLESKVFKKKHDYCLYKKESLKRKIKNSNLMMKIKKILCIIQWKEPEKF